MQFVVYLLFWTQSCLKNNDEENNLNQTHCKTIKHIVNVISHCGDNKQRDSSTEEHY